MRLINLTVFFFIKSLCTAYFISKKTIYTKHNTLFMIPLSTNNTEWTLPSMNGLQSLYKPPRIVPFVPYNVARSLMIQCFVNALNANNDILIIQSDNFRKALNENKPCDFNYTYLSTYWKQIINLYSLY